MTDIILQAPIAIQACPGASKPVMPTSPIDDVSSNLRSSEIRYRRLFEAARDGIFILDSDQGRITDANPFMSELLGYSRDELIGKQIWEIGLLKDKDAGQEAFRQLKDVGYIRYENLPLETRRGESREVEFVSNLYRESDRTVIQCNIRDITERKLLDMKRAAAAAKNERIVETLQKTMLQTTPSGKFSGLSMETLYVAALKESEVGGDFFDAFALGEGLVAFVVGDVSGKGLIAAGRTAEVKYAMRAFLHEYQSPEKALAHLNDFICETHRLDKESNEAFIVLALAVIDAVSGTVTFTAAGAEPTLILRGNGTSETIEISGCPLGIEPNSVYTLKTAFLEPGETVVMATDGITEARNGASFLGIDGLAKIIEQAGSGTSLQDLCRDIYERASEFAGTGLRDDVCLLVARRLPV